MDVRRKLQKLKKGTEVNKPSIKIKMTVNVAPTVAPPDSWPAASAIRRLPCQNARPFAAYATKYSTPDCIPTAVAFFSPSRFDDHSASANLPSNRVFAPNACTTTTFDSASLAIEAAVAAWSATSPEYFSM
jgi:hypothetical protein